MPAAALSRSEWEEVRKASEAGVDDVQLSQDYGVTRAAIRKRRQLDGWMTPRKLQEELEIAKVRNQMRSGRADSHDSQKPSAEESIAKKMLRDGETAGIHAMAILLKKLAFAAENPQTIDDLESVGDVATAVKAARSIAGMDKTEGGGIHINLGSFFGTSRNEERETHAIVVSPKPQLRGLE